MQSSKKYTLLLIILVMLPSGCYASPFYEQILAYYPEEDIGFGIYANLTYTPRDVYFDVPWEINFTLDIVLPSNSNISLNLTRLFVFLDFYEERIIFPVFDDALGLIETNQSQRIVDEPLILIASLEIANELFIVEDYNGAYLGFLVVFEGVFSSEDSNTTISSRNLYSREPDGMDWYQYPRPQRPSSNADYLIIHRYNFIDFSLAITPLIFLGLLIIVCSIFLYYKSIRIRLFIGTAKMAGKRIHLGGQKIAYAYLAVVISRDNVPAATEFLAKWTRKKLSIELNDSLDIDQLEEDERQIWNEVKGEIWRKQTSVIITSIIQSKYPNERSEYLLEKLKKMDMGPITQRSKFIGDADRRFSDWADALAGRGTVKRKYEGIHKIIESKKDTTYNRLELLGRNLDQILADLIETSDQLSAVNWRISGQICRTLVQGFTESIIEKLLPGQKQHPDWKTNEKLKQIFEEIEQQLKGHKDRELILISNSLPYYISYFEALELLIQKTGHKSMSKMTRDEADRCIVYTFLWISDIINLLDYIGFNWLGDEDKLV